MDLEHKTSWRYLLGWTFILLMVVSATYLHDVEIILPEIGALTAGTWIYRKADWTRQPRKLFLAPSGTAVIGFLVNRLPTDYPIKVLIGVLLMLLLLKGLRFNLAPAFATGLLPIIINATHWSFIVAIFFWTLSLMVGVRLQQRQPAIHSAPATANWWQMLGFSCLVLLWVSIVWFVGQPQMAAIPPVIVVFFEATQQTDYSVKLAIKQWTALTAAATIGVGVHLLVASWLLTTILTMPSVYLLLLGLRLKLPAAYAFPLLALVLPTEMFDKLPLSAALAAAFFLGALLAYQRVLDWVRAAVTEN
ncbi:hypothetical protein ACA598_12665 [Lactiplantibacillus pentosus]|uniref:hypothetical protein n=1 Tax=Lactiplantibacillus pentosus TaxID=1589 RepID=UPI003C2457F2